jgi:hypothetical protein
MKAEQPRFGYLSNRLKANCFEAAEVRSAQEIGVRND